MVITCLLLLIEEAGLSDYFSGLLMICALIETSDNRFKGNKIVVLWPGSFESIYTTIQSLGPVRK